MSIEWTDFPIKELILRYLDYESRCNLRVCSKENRNLVDSHRFIASKTVLSEIPSNMDGEKSILRLDIDSFTIWFIGKDEVTRVERAWNGEIMEWSETKQENRVDVFRRYVDKFLMKKTHETDELQIIGPSFEPSENWKFRCSSLFLVSPGSPSEWVIRWMNTVEPELKELIVNNWSLEGISDLPHILSTTKKLRLSETSDLNDEHLEKIKATDLEISSLNITPVGIQKALENYLENRESEDRFVMCTHYPQDFNPVNLFPKHLILKEIESVMPEHKMFRIIGAKNGVLICKFFATVFHVIPEPKKQKKPCILWPFTFRR